MHLFWSRWGRYRVTSSGCTMSSQPKLCMMAWTGLGWRSWGAEVGRSKDNRVKPEDEVAKEQEGDLTSVEACYAFVHPHTLHCLRHFNSNPHNHSSSTHTLFLSPRRERMAKNKPLSSVLHPPLPSLVLLTCCGVGQRRRGGLREAHAAHEWVEVCPEGRCHRQVALFHCTGRSPWRGGRGRPDTLLVDPSGRGTKTQVNKCTGCRSATPPPIPPHPHQHHQSNPESCVSDCHSFMCFSSPLSWGITGCSGALRCRVGGGGAVGVWGESKKGGGRGRVGVSEAQGAAEP